MPGSPALDTRKPCVQGSDGVDQQDVIKQGGKSMELISTTVYSDVADDDSADEAVVMLDCQCSDPNQS